MRINMQQTTGKNICSAQEKQRHGYNRRHQIPDKIKMGEKVLQRINEWIEKVVNFHPNDLVIHSNSISNKNFCSFINKDGTQTKTKYNFSLLRPYLDSDETKFTCG